MRIRRSNFHQGRTRIRFDLHLSLLKEVPNVEFGYAHLYDVYATKMLGAPSPSNHSQCFRCFKTSRVA
jgi:hypothetical protein